MTNLKHFNNKDPWYLGEDIPDMDFFFSQIWLNCFVNNFKYPSGRAYQKILTVFRGYHLWFYFGKKDSWEEGEYIVNKFLKKPEFTKQINENIIIEADKLRRFANQLPEEHLSKLTNKQLWEIYNKHYQVHSHYYQWCWIPVAVDMFHDNLTEKLKSHLRDIKVKENKINEYLVLLTQPTKKSLIQKEHEEFLKIASNIYKKPKQKKIIRDYFKVLQDQAAAKYGLKTHTPEYEEFLEQRMSQLVDNIDKTILKALEKHYQTYYYVKFMWIGKEGVYSFDYYLKELVKLIGTGVNPESELVKLNREYKQLLVKRKQLIKKLKIRNPWLTVINSWGDFMVTKIYRRYAQIYAIYRMQPVLKEIAKRLKLNIKQVKFLLIDEVKQGLLQNKLNRQSIKDRTSLCVHYIEKGTTKIFTGNQASKLATSVEKQDLAAQDEISGQTGCIGRARGTVRIIIRPKDMVKMKKGDILVSIATDPDIVPAMKKAAAIVTEQGGVTSHAAIVSREMNIPCVIGTKIVTKVLKDGDQVEVDAYKGIVKKVK